MKRSARRMAAFAGVALWIMPYVGIAGSEDADEIIRKANRVSYYSGKDGKAKVLMTITDSRKRKRIREFVILRRDISDGGDQKFYLYFKRPGDVRKMVFMVHKHIGKDDDRWLYLPALDLVKRIAASDRRTSFAGSNFFYEDVSGRSPEEDIHELTEVTEKHYIIEGLPKDPGSVEFARYKVWIDRNTWLPVKSEYADKEGKTFRIIDALNIKKIQGFPTVVKARAVDLLSKSETVIEFSNVEYDIGIDDKIFTERYLRKTPGIARR